MSLQLLHSKCRATPPTRIHLPNSILLDRACCLCTAQPHLSFLSHLVESSLHWRVVCTLYTGRTWHIGWCESKSTTISLFFLFADVIPIVWNCNKRSTHKPCTLFALAITLKKLFELWTLRQLQTRPKDTYVLVRLKSKTLLIYIYIIN